MHSCALRLTITCAFWTAACAQVGGEDGEAGDPSRPDHDVDVEQPDAGGALPEPDSGAATGSDPSARVLWNWPGDSYWNVDQHVQIVQRGDDSSWVSAWSWSGSSAPGGFVGIASDADRFDGTAGDVALFTMLGASGGQGTACAAASYDGVAGRSCRIPLTLVLDRYYRLRVWRLDADTEGQWWGAWIKDETTGVETWIGSLRVAAELTGITAPYNEARHDGSAAGCAVPASIARFTQPAANQLEVASYEHYTTLDRGVVGDCGDATVTAHDFTTTKGAEVQIGGR